jgi:RNA polymerase-binding transcription factor DksA
MVKNSKTKKINSGAIKYPEEVVKPVKEHLLSRLLGLEKQKKELAAEDPFNDKSRLDDNAAIDSDAAERVGHMQVSAVKQALDRSIIQIRKALAQIKVGNYGICEECGNMIDTDRLVVMPEITICVSCEKKREK